MKFTPKSHHVLAEIRAGILKVIQLLKNFYLEFVPAFSRLQSASNQLTEKILSLFLFLKPLKQFWKDHTNNKFFNGLRKIRSYNPFKYITFWPARFLVYFFLLITLVFISVDSNFLHLFGYSPTFKDIRNPQFSVGSELLTNDGKLIGKFYKENRNPAKYEELPKNLIDALISTEDERFYKHHGIDYYSLFSSIWSTARGDKRGGSTITQQLAKNLYHTRRKNSNGLINKIPGIGTLVVKMKEWVTALKIENIYSKPQILALYLNTVSFGNNTYGIKVAAKKYFDKKPADLAVQESALLVGMLKATSTYNPENNPEKALARRNIVLGQMVKNKVLSEADFRRSSSLPIQLDVSYELDEEDKDSYIRSAVSTVIRAWAKKKGYDIYADGLKIYTTIDSKFQEYAEEAVNSKMKILQATLSSQWQGQNPWVDENGDEIKDFVNQMVRKMPHYDQLSRHYSHPGELDAYLQTKKRMRVFSWKGEKDTTFSTIDSLTYYARMLQTGMMTLDPFSGYIKAWVGGIDNDYFKYDHVVQAKRQPGSTFKPFVYLAALESGYTPCDKITDKPVTISYIDVVDGQHKTWSPKNSDWKNTGYDMSLRWAMAKSVNSVTAQLTEKVGPENVVKYAKLLGIHGDLKAVPSIGLGPFDVSLFDMVGAYGTFLNHGTYTEPMLVARIEDNDGNVIENFKPKRKEVLSEEISWLMLYMFRGGVEEPGGTSQSLYSYDLWKKGNELGGKTGTSSNFSDSWYIGISKDLVTGIWIGAENRSIHFKTSQTGEGARTALPIFGAYMEKLYHDPKSGVTYGKFPKALNKISRKFYCPTPIPKRDTVKTDSTKLLTVPDSVSIPAI